DGIQQLRALPAHDGCSEPGVRPEAAEAAEERDQRARPASRQDPADRGVPQTEAAPALGWTAAAGRDGTRDRARAAGLPHGRAALEPRREAPRPDARGDPPAPAPPRGRA